MTDFIIFGHPRTGSNHLCSMLNQVDDVVAHYEIFHQDGIYFAGIVEDTPLAALVTADAIQDRNANPLEFMKKVRKASEKSIMGFKLFPGQNAEIEDFLCAAASVRKVVLYRQNVLAVFASDKIAEKSNQYFFLNTQQARSNSVRLVFNSEEFAYYENNYHKWYASVIKRISDAGQDFFFLPYENVNSPGLVRAVVLWISRKNPSESLKSPHVKSGAMDISQRFENQSDVLDYLSATNRLNWRYDAAVSAP